MFSLSFLKSKFFFATIVFLVFVAFTYKVYDKGYMSAVAIYTEKALDAKEKHDKEIAKLQGKFDEQEAEFLRQKAINQKEFEIKYKSAMEAVNDYIESNDFSDCSIGPNGVQRVNDILKGTTSKDK